MKKTLFILSTLLLGSGAVLAQNIGDNKVTFQYIQLPKIKIDDKFNAYEVRVEHAYKDANQDSLAMHEMRKQAALTRYEQELVIYHRMKDSIDRTHLRAMADWEIKKNAGTLGADGNPLPQPSQPFYPTAPILKRVEGPRLHTELADNQVIDNISIEGFEKGLGGAIVTLKVLPIRNIQIVSTKKGSGASTKYDYRCLYTLPIELTLATPTQGTLTQFVINQGQQSYSIKSFKSSYEYELYMMDNKDQFYMDLERAARNNAISSARNYLNDNFGYVLRNRVAELYTVNRHKKYDYSDVTNAYTKSVQALSQVKNDRDRSGAADMIEDALEMWKSIMEESNTFDNAARINDKISAMIQCNMAELYVWLGEFNDSEMQANLALNSGEGKAKRHLNGELGFYKDQRVRWEANY
ncbi:MAG: hypothetical protein ACO2Z9_03365 [Crocinitomicaceae bacterium]